MSSSRHKIGEYGEKIWERTEVPYIQYIMGLLTAQSGGRLGDLPLARQQANRSANART